MRLPRLLGVLVCGTVIALSARASGTTWHKVSAPHIVVYTAGSPQTAKNWVIALEGFRRSLLELTHNDDASLDSFVLVVFKDEKGYTSVLKPGVRNDVLTVSSGRFYSDQGAIIGAVNPSEEEMARYAVFSQAGLWMNNSFRWPLPLWLMTGLDQLYSRHYLESGDMTIGGPIAQNVHLLDERLALPLDQMLSMTTDSPYYRSSKFIDFNAQTWAFTHYLFIGDNGTHRAQLTRYLDALSGNSNYDAFAMAFPEGMKAVEKQFAHYVRAGMYAMTTLPYSVAELSRAVTVSRPSEVELQVTLGRLYLRARDVSVAAPYFERAAQLAPADPLTLEGLADLARANGDNSKAIELFDRAARAGSKNYLAHYYAQMAKVQAMVGGEEAQDRFDPAAVRAAADEMKRTLKLRPGFYPAAEAFAGLIGGLHTATPEDGELLTALKARFPDRGLMEAGLIAYEIKTEKYVTAKKHIERFAARRDLDVSSLVATYVEKLDRRIGALVDLAWVQKFYQDGKPDEARKLLERLRSAPLLPGEFKQMEEVSSMLSADETLASVRDAMKEKRWEDAEILLENLTSDDMQATIRAKVAATKAELAKAKAAKN